MPEPGRRQRRSAFFATCPAGLARLLRDQLAAVPGVEVTGTGSDGQADYVLFDADRAGREEAIGSRLADGVFVVAGRASRGRTADPSLLAGRCWQADGVQRALSVWAEQVRPLRAGQSFQIAARMQTGPRALRAGLRDALAAVIGRDRPKWKPSAQGELQVWLAEWRDGELACGLRVGGSPGALAAAMVWLAGPAEGVLLDPCCGTGGILAEALAAGWTAAGTDPDPDHVVAARGRAPGAAVQEGYPHEIMEPDDSVAACVSRLGPGQGELGPILAELSRVTRTGGSVILLAPQVPHAEIPAALRLRRQVPVRLASSRETIWVLRRA
jgi:SAM-dependent methyltransferase